MILAQELIPVDSLIEAGVVTILAIVIFFGVVSFFYMIRLFRQMLSTSAARDTADDETTNKLVTLTANAISNSEKLALVLEQNTEGYKGLAKALTEFKAGIETKLDENTKAINELATELREGNKVSVKALVGLFIPIEMSDGTIYTISVIEENEQIKIKLTKQETKGGDRNSTAS